MKHWLGRTPRTVGDWLGLALGTALIFGGVAQLPALAAALGQQRWGRLRHGPGGRQTGLAGAGAAG